MAPELEPHHFIKVEFRRFKAFERFVLNLRHFNILVGPNNAGKSTILAAFRILAAALRKAMARNPEIIRGLPTGNHGYSVDLRGVSVAEENIFFNYDDSEPASVRFTLSNGNELTLFFPERGACYLIASMDGYPPKSTSAFRKHFNCSVGFVPILGPVEQTEYLYQEEAARLALFNYTAARNFRNIWHHYPERFEQFRQILAETWPGMDIQKPEVQYGEGKPRLIMMCPEERIPREIFWAGFGFQVWCQMLTHLVQSRGKSLFLIDEPDIYLHADLQRQLLGLLRNLGPDVLIATHSTEIITEAEAEDIVLINKKRTHARRIKHPSELSNVFVALGSNLNPILTQLAKTRRAVFVEGKDFQIVGKFARKLGSTRVGNRNDFAVIPVEGFNPERIRNLISGIESTLGGKISSAVILDRDYRSPAECDFIREKCREFSSLVRVHSCKEIENFLLVPDAIDRVMTARTTDRMKRFGRGKPYVPCSAQLLEEFAQAQDGAITSRYLAEKQKFEKRASPGLDASNVVEAGLAEFCSRWAIPDERLRMVPGKDAHSQLNQKFQSRFGVTTTSTGIIDAMKAVEVPQEMKSLIKDLERFASLKPGAELPDTVR